MTERLISRLELLGVPVPDEDIPRLAAALEEAEAEALAGTGLDKLPEELSTAIVNAAAGRYLFYKKSTGSLEGFDLAAAVKQVSEGDASVTYAIGDGSLTPEQRLDALIGQLSSLPESLLVKWRRLRW